MTELTTAACSVTRTARRRYFWAAWWTTEPQWAPFQKPDASNGGARSFEEALAQAERAAGRSLGVIEPYWARAWKCLLRGEPLPAQPVGRPTSARSDLPQPAWAVLGVAKDAPVEAIKRAFQQKALETHPDQGGDAERFREVMRAFERMTAKRRVRRRRAR